MPGARIFKTGTPYNAVELPQMDYVQSFDVVYLAHLDHLPTKLVRNGDTDWSFITVSIGPSLAAPTAVGVTATIANTDAANSGNSYFPEAARYVVTATSDDAGQESRASLEVSATNDLTLKRNSNSITLTGSAGADRYRIYKAVNQQAFGFIGETTTLSFTDNNIKPDLTDGPPEAYYPFDDSNNPSTVTFFESRLFWARTKLSPNAFYSSRSQDFENMDVARPTREDDAITARISAQKVNAINSLVPLRSLVALTGNGVYVIEGSNTPYLTAAPPPAARKQPGSGASRLKPVVAGEVVFYQPPIGSSVNTLGFTYEVDGFQSTDVSIFSPGLFKNFTLKSWTYAEHPLSVIWTARSDGKAPTFTWQQEQQVWGWTLAETQGVVEDVCAVAEGGEHRLYWIARRTIGGVERRFLERLDTAKWSNVENSCYVDCALTFYPATPTSHFYVPHLAGETVNALADGFTINGLVVAADGFVELNYEVQRVATIGLGFDAVIETLPLSIQTAEGYARDKKQSVGAAVLQVTHTRLGGIEAGRRIDKMYPIKARRTEALGAATALYTGATSVETEPFVSGESTLFVRSSEALPMTITAIYLDPIVTQS